MCHPAFFAPEIILFFSEISLTIRGTSHTTADSIKHHFEKHGKNKTLEQYTQDAKDFFDNNRGKMKDVILKDGTKGVIIRKGEKGGYFTPDGKIVSYWED